MTAGSIFHRMEILQLLDQISSVANAFAITTEGEYAHETRASPEFRILTIGMIE